MTHASLEDRAKFLSPQERFELRAGESRPVLERIGAYLGSDERLGVQPHPANQSC